MLCWRYCSYVVVSANIRRLNYSVPPPSSCIYIHLQFTFLISSFSFLHPYIISLYDNMLYYSICFFISCQHNIPISYLLYITTYLFHLSINLSIYQLSTYPRLTVLKMSWLENRRSLKQLLKNWIKHLLRCQDTKPCSESYSGSYCTMLSVLPNPEPCSLFRVPDWTCSEPSLTSTFKTWTTFFFFHHNLKFVIFIFTI